MARRANLASLTAARRQELAQHLVHHATDELLTQHNHLDHTVARILSDHRQLLLHVEAELRGHVELPGGRMPKWDPATPIPPEFEAVRPEFQGAPLPRLENLTPNRPTPAELLPPRCWDYADEQEFARALLPWHDGVHDAVGGTMRFRDISPAAAIFFPWHAWIDDLFEGFLSGSTATARPCVLREGDQQLALFYRGRDDWLVFRHHDRQRWSPEERFNRDHQFPTRLSSDVFHPERCPAAVSDWLGHRFAVFFRGEGDRMRWKAHHGGRWHNDAPLEGSGPITSDPAVARAGNQLGLFYRGAGDWLVWRLHDGERWHAEECFADGHRVPTKLEASVWDPVRSPAVLGDWQGHRWAVFFRGREDRLNWKAHHDGEWHHHAEVAGSGRMTSDPAVAAAIAGDTGVFYRGAGDWLVWRLHRDGREWHPEERFDDTHPYPSKLLSAPTAVAGWQGHRFAVYFRTDDNRLRWKAYHSGRWHHDAFVT